MSASLISPAERLANARRAVVAALTFEHPTPFEVAIVLTREYESAMREAIAAPKESA